MTNNYFDRIIDNKRFKLLPCKKCGKLPTLRTEYNELDKSAYVGCFNENTSCENKVLFQDNLQETINLWNVLNDKSIEYKPKSKLRSVRIYCCATCQLKDNCLVAKKLDVDDLYVNVCYDHI